MTNATRACVGCNASLAGTHPNTKRCTSCNRLKRIKSVPRSCCAECDGSMEGKRADAIYCSVPCAERAGYRRRTPAAVRHDERTCADCGTSVTDRGSNARLCIPCARRRSSGTLGPKAKAPVRITRTCATCGQEFIAKRQDSMCCSRRCTVAKINAKHNAAKYVRPTARKCLGCSSEFTPPRSDGQWCSGTCYRKHARPYVPVQRVQRRCAACGTAFTPGRSDAIYCSRNCLSGFNAQRRRAWKSGNRDSVGITPRDWLRLLNRHRGHCAYCDSRTDRLTMDHVIPLSRGGRHAIGNVLPICGWCNSSKSAAFLVEWRRRRHG